MIWFYIWLGGYIIWAAIQTYGYVRLEKCDPRLRGEYRAALLLDGFVWPYLMVCSVPLILTPFVILYDWSVKQVNLRRTRTEFPPI